MKPAQKPTDAELLASIALLKSPAYLGLSRIHSEALEVLEGQARGRNLKTDPARKLPERENKPLSGGSRA